MPAIKRPSKPGPFPMASPLIRSLIIAGLLLGGFAQRARLTSRARSTSGWPSSIRPANWIFPYGANTRSLTWPSGAVLQEGRNLRESRISSHPDGITINDKKYPLRRIRLASSKDIALYLDDKVNRYRGALDIILKSNKNFWPLIPLRSNNTSAESFIMKCRTAGRWKR